MKISDLLYSHMKSGEPIPNRLVPFLRSKGLDIGRVLTERHFSCKIVSKGGDWVIEKFRPKRQHKGRKPANYHWRVIEEILSDPQPECEEDHALVLQCLRETFKTNPGRMAEKRLEYSKAINTTFFWWLDGENWKVWHAETYGREYLDHAPWNEVVPVDYAKMKARKDAIFAEREEARRLSNPVQRTAEERAARLKAEEDRIRKLREEDERLEREHAERKARKEALAKVPTIPGLPDTPLPDPDSPTFEVRVYYPDLDPNFDYWEPI